MESESIDPTPDDAQAVLARVAHTRARAAVDPSRRARAVYRMSEAVVLGGYFATVLLATPHPGDSVPNPFTLLLVPLLLGSALARGTMARCGIRVRDGWRSVLTPLVLAAVAVIAIAAEAPVGLRVMLSVAAAVILVVPPTIELGKTRSPSDRGRARLDLGLPATVVTMLIGAACGVTAATATDPVASSFVFFAVAILTFAGVVMEQSQWGLTAVGSRWGRAQWVCFGAVAAALAAMAILSLHTDIATVGGAVVGAVTTAIMIIAALLPGASAPAGSAGTR